jgi:hypothetical protein
MAAHRTAAKKPDLYWTGIGVAIGAGSGMLLGLLGPGGDSIAIGVSVGAGVGVALGAARDARTSRLPERDVENQTRQG